MTIDTQELRKLAEGAEQNTASPWYLENGFDQVRDNEDEFVCDTGEIDGILARFIAAANPATVFTLLDTIDAQAREIERLTREMEEAKRIANDHRDGRLAALERIAELESRAVPDEMTIGEMDWCSDKSAAQLYVEGWNACRRTMLATPPAPAEGE